MVPMGLEEHASCDGPCRVVSQATGPWTSHRVGDLAFLALCPVVAGTPVACRVHPAGNLLLSRRDAGCSWLGCRTGGTRRMHGLALKQQPTLPASLLLSII